MEQDYKQKKWISFVLDAEANELLTLSATRSNRQKRKEAFIRLKDHLSRFRSISEVGNVTSFEEKLKKP